MSEPEVGDLLHRLREHLPETEASAEQLKLMQQIEYHLHEEGEPDPETPNLRQSLELLIEEVEAENPQGAAVARRLINLLYSMGI